MFLLLLYILIFWYLWNLFFNDLIKHYVFSFFLFMFPFLQLIFIHNLLIEYDIYIPNDFFIFIIPLVITEVINTISNKGTLLGFFFNLCSIFFINMEKCFTTESFQKEYFTFFPVHSSYGILPSKELEGPLFIK